MLKKLFPMGILVALLLLSLPIDAIKASAEETPKKGSAEIMLISVEEEGEFTDSQKDEIEESGWNVQGNTIFLVRKLANETIIVNDQEVQTDDNGKFEVDENLSQIKVKLPQGNETTVSKDANGEFKFTEAVDWNSFNEQMDFVESQESQDNQQDSDTFTTMAYGKKYVKGDWVHCNRFNGPSSDGYHYPKTNWRAYRNFVGSDCDWALAIRCVKDYTSNTWCNGSGGAAACSGKIGHSKKYHKH
ncbi:hypothetical protein [Priestia endophytica]|uniref:Uncharacterized protein n=1 Tax=Priestia endophytica TaxID=135735 RepID=A0AAX1Q7J3_9BACI|nr:hypothetical protein [Priestia endophytica]RAS76665.1 hypothetical protein A3864_12645 [Priestia endophytica]